RAATCVIGWHSPVANPGNAGASSYWDSRRRPAALSRRPEERMSRLLSLSPACACWTLAVALVGLASAPADAQDLNPLTTLEASRTAARIVLARCEGVQVREAAGGHIFTYVDFRALQVVKGELPTGFGLRLLGGRVGNVEIEAPLMPKFVAGEEVVL